jgi:hypothetical protein
VVNQVCKLLYEHQIPSIESSEKHPRDLQTCHGRITMGIERTSGVYRPPYIFLWARRTCTPIRKRGKIGSRVKSLDSVDERSTSSIFLVHHMEKSSEIA